MKSPIGWHAAVRHHLFACVVPAAQPGRPELDPALGATAKSARQNSIHVSSDSALSASHSRHSPSAPPTPPAFHPPARGPGGRRTSLATSASSRTQRMRVPNTRGETRMAMRSSAAASMRPAGASLASAAVTTTCGPPRRAGLGLTHRVGEHALAALQQGVSGGPGMGRPASGWRTAAQCAGHGRPRGCGAGQRGSREGRRARRAHAEVKLDELSMGQAWYNKV